MCKIYIFFFFFPCNFTVFILYFVAFTVFFFYQTFFPHLLWHCCLLARIILCIARCERQQ